jgi:AdoMet-dependent heme synthase
MVAPGPRFDFADRPFILFWEITRACALACRHCRATAQSRPDPAQLDHRESLALIDQVAELRPAMFVLTGGDPMLRGDLADLIRYSAGHHGLHTSLSPSATPLLLRADFAALKAAGIQRLSLSLDGATRETHDGFRGLPHTFDRTLRAVEMARDAGIPLQINTTIHKGNLHEFDAFAELMHELRPAMWSLFLVVPTGRATLADLPTAEEIEDIFERLYEIACTAPFEVKTTEGHHYRRIVVQHDRSAGRMTTRAPLGIRDGRGVAFISHTGEISPSGFLPVVAGNVRQDSLAGVYRNHPLFVNLRDNDRLLGKCGRCEFRSICGGSRARSLAVAGDVFAEEPLCSYEPPAR